MSRDFDYTAVEYRSSDSLAPATKWNVRVRAQGPWNQQRTSQMLQGATSLPMPVRIAEPSTLIPCFNHIANNGTHTGLANSDHSFRLDTEQNYQTPFIEFEKGVIYADRRMDLCKMVLGPTSIDVLLDALETNLFVKHFLLGNNIIGPAGCRRIAKFIRDFPEGMDTWYLAGNCIDTACFAMLIEPLVQSTCSDLWLKRNPLGSASAFNVARLIQESSTLRTLDLDQTNLGDDGVTQLFEVLCSAKTSAPLLLENIYLNAVGIGFKAAASLSRFLRSPSCQLKSLYLSNNPMGDDGAVALATGLKLSQSLQRVMLSSTGLTSIGVNSILEAIMGHSNLIALDLGQSFATEDLESHFNWITDSSVRLAQDLILDTPNLRYLDLSYSCMSHKGINVIMEAAIKSISLCYLNLSTVESATTNAEIAAVRAGRQLEKIWKKRVGQNIAIHYNGMSSQQFHAEEKRWLAGLKDDLRKIDSVYRNRDAGLARRGLKRLEKHWDENDDTLARIMSL